MHVSISPQRLGLASYRSIWHGTAFENENPAIPLRILLDSISTCIPPRLAISEGGGGGGGYSAFGIR